MARTWKGMSKGKKPLWKVKVERFVRKRMAQPLLKAIRDYEEGHITLENYEQKRDTLPLSIKDIMTGIGMDYEKRLDYDKVQGFFSENRKLLTLAMTQFVQADKSGKSDYHKHKEKGLSNDEIFYHFIHAAMTYNIYPFYADRNDQNKLKPLEREHYMALLHQRLKAIGKEVERRAKEVRKIDQRIPIAGLIEKREFKDGTLFQLPSAYDCEACGETFDSQSELAKHYQDEH